VTEGPSLPEQYWSEPEEHLLSTLGSRPDGLGPEEAQDRLRQYGPNTLRIKRRDTALSLFLNQFRSPIILILLFATGLSAVTREWVDAAIIFAIVLGSALLSFTQEYSAGNTAEKLKARVRAKANALRGGKIVTIPAEEVVPGDIVALAAGSLVPGDGVLLEAQDLFASQAVLTGETFPVEKRPGPVAPRASLTERINCVCMGTNIRSGTGRVLIVRTGASTAFGRIAGKLALRPPETEFERGVRRFGYLLSEVMLILVLIIFAANVYLHKPVLDSLLFSIALAVGITPQLLPAILSITLSKGSHTLAAAGVIVRRLEAIENFGSTDVLCTDKTGTLSEGVVQLDGALDVDGRPSDDVFRHAYLNAHFQTGLPNPLDEAILNADTARSLRESAWRPDDFTKASEVPYDFVRKRLSVVVQGRDGPPLLITKSALENVLSACTRARRAEGEVPLDQE
jgi:Mg2+-importing ATPase